MNLDLHAVVLIQLVANVVLLVAVAVLLGRRAGVAAATATAAFAAETSAPPIRSRRRPGPPTLDVLLEAEDTPGDEARGRAARAEGPAPARRREPVRVTPGPARLSPRDRARAELAASVADFARGAGPSLSTPGEPAGDDRDDRDDRDDGHDGHDGHDGRAFADLRRPPRTRETRTGRLS